MGDVVIERGDEGLVGDERLGVGAAVEDGRALAVRAPCELRRQPRLADPGLARQQHELALAGLGGGVAAGERREQRLAPDERPAAGLDRQRGRERDRRRDRQDGVGRGVAGGHAALARRGLPVLDRRQRRAAEVARRRVAVARVLGHRPPHDLAEQLAGVREDREHGRRRRVEVREHRRRRGLARVRDLARDRLVEHAAERVDVGARVDRALLELLGRGVVERPDHAPHLRDLRLRAQVLHQAEVGQDGVHLVAGDLDQDVGGLDVAVDDPGRVGGVERVADLRDEARGEQRFEPALGAQQARQVGALDVAHRHVQQPVLLARVVDRDHVGMLDRGRRAELAPEAPAELVVVGELGRDHLQRDLAVERDVRRAVDDAHPAAPGDAVDHVVGERRPRRHLRHWPRR